MNVMNIAISGMNAASTKMDAAASNIVNRQSSNYKPVEVENKSVAGGGVEAEVRPVEPSTVPVVSPEGSVEAMPNVDEVVETVNMITAEQAYAASAKIIQAADEMSKELLDIKKA